MRILTKSCIEFTLFLIGWWNSSLERCDVLMWYLLLTWYTSVLFLCHWTVTQAIWSRTDKFDFAYLPILPVINVTNLAKPSSVWLNIEVDLLLLQLEPAKVVATCYLFMTLSSIEANLSFIHAAWYFLQTAWFEYDKIHPFNFEGWFCAVYLVTWIGFSPKYIRKS